MITGDKVFAQDPQSEQDLNHASVIIGWGEKNKQKYWILRNSYGESYGDNSVIFVERGTNAFRLEENLAGFDVELLENQKKWSSFFEK